MKTNYRRHAFLILLVLLLGLRLPPGASAQTRRIELADLAKITSVSDPQISPDGKSIVFVVSRPNLEQDRSDRELVQMDIASGAQHSLTYERKGVGSPRWSPNGDRLAFVAVEGTGKDARPQVFVLPMTGGEARKLTDAPNGIEQFAWRPNGQDIAYVSSDEPENKKEIEKHHDAFEVGDNDFLATEAALPSHIWILPADRRKSQAPHLWRMESSQERASKFAGFSDFLVARRQVAVVHSPGASPSGRRGPDDAASSER